jgi:hypothetical protein
LVKAADLGYLSKNLERIPDKETLRDQEVKKAVLNLTSVEPPERLSSLPLPGSLFSKE